MAERDLNSCTALETRPVCPSNASHGYMELRPIARQTKEQRWCGVWYDCADAGCRTSVLYQSSELLAHIAEAMGRIKVEYSKLTSKRKRDLFLRGCAPWVAAELVSANANA